MLFEEITHSNDIVQDIRNIFSDEIHTLVFLSKEVFKELKLSKGIYKTNLHLDNCYHYSENAVTCLEKTLSGKAPFFDKTTDVIGIVRETDNLYMLLYFKSIYVNIDWIDNFKVKREDFLATIDMIKKIVILK